MRKSLRQQEVEDACGKDSALPVGQSCVRGLGTPWGHAAGEEPAPRPCPAQRCCGLVWAAGGPGSAPVPVWGPAGLLGTLGPALGCCPVWHVLWEPAAVWLPATVKGEQEWSWDRQAWGPDCVPAPSSASTWWLRLGPCLCGVCRWSCARPAFPEPCVLGRGLGAALSGLPDPLQEPLSRGGAEHSSRRRGGPSFLLFRGLSRGRPQVGCCAAVTDGQRGGPGGCFVTCFVGSRKGLGPPLGAERVDAERCAVGYSLFFLRLNSLL